MARRIYLDYSLFMGRKWVESTILFFILTSLFSTLKSNEITFKKTASRFIFTLGLALTLIGAFYKAFHYPNGLLILSSGIALGVIGMMYEFIKGGRKSPGKLISAISGSLAVPCILLGVLYNVFFGKLLLVVGLALAGVWLVAELLFNGAQYSDQNHHENE